jgi:hypothetical protein
VSIETVGFAAGDLLLPNTYYRLTVANHWYNANETFPTAARALYDSLYQRAQVIPLTALTVPNGSAVTVIDVSLKAQKYGADLVNALDEASNASDNYAFVSRIEKLNSAADATGAGSTDARTQAVAAATANQGATNELSKFFDSLANIGSVAKWVGIGIAILALFYLASPYLARRRG